MARKLRPAGRHRTRGTGHLSGTRSGARLRDTLYGKTILHPLGFTAVGDTWFAAVWRDRKGRRLADVIDPGKPDHAARYVASSGASGAARHDQRNTAVRTHATQAGERGSSSGPMGNAGRLSRYLDQGPTGAGLSPRQHRRLTKKFNANHLEE